MKPREPRKKALVAARIKSGATWGDVCLLNLSSRGALCQTANPPPQGAYIEVRRGSHVVVARVMWTEKNRFGIHSQDVIAVDDILSGCESITAHQSCSQKHDRVERRRYVRNLTTGERHEQSRLMARCAEFFCLVAAAAIVASFISSVIQDTLARPMSHLTTVLASR